MNSLRTMSVLATALVSACASTDEADGSVTYETHVRPVLQSRCVVCHHEEFTPARNLVDPFDPETGLFVNENSAAASGHDTLEYNVVAGNPDASALIKKISDRELLPGFCDPLANPEEEDCPIERTMKFMPPQYPPSNAEQISRVRQWITDGAGDTEFFRTSVRPIFGDGNFRNACGRGGYEPGCTLCLDCHYAGTPTSPDLATDPIQSLVGVPALYRSDLELVVPGDPDASFLVMKMEARGFTTALGAPMPYPIEPLSEEQVEAFRRWVAEGARP